MSTKRVFISYSSADGENAFEVCRLLEERGIDCWIAPRNVPAGAKWGESIEHAIEDALAVVLIFSEHSNKSEQVMNEVERSVSKKKRICPLKISPVTPNPELAYFISRRHWLDASNGSLEKCIEQLVEAINQPEIIPKTFDLPQKDSTRPPATRKILLLVGAGLLVALVAILASFLTLRSLREPSRANSQLNQAYQALEQKDWTTAESLFQQMTARPENPAKSKGYTGLAALAFARGDFNSALDLAEQAEALDPEIAYSHVISGHILFQQGNLKEATTQYLTATQKANSLPWQKAIAYNRLGRIQAAQGKSREALQQYEKAIQQHQKMAVAYANKGYLLEKTGKTDEALALYRKALELDPDDSVTRALLRGAEKRRQFDLDLAKQDRIDKLVAELVQIQKEGKRPPVVSDQWTSAPLTLCFLDFQFQGTLASREGESDFLRLQLEEALQMSGRIVIVEREILDKLLTELKLSAAELTDSRTALRVGRILAARLIASGKLIRFGEESKVNIRVVETETTRIRASASEIIDNNKDLDDALEQISKKLLDKFKAAFPLRGRIAEVTSQDVILNIGADQGLTPGLTLQVFGGQDPVETLSSPVGLLEVTHVGENLSRAKVLEQAQAFARGWKVKEVQQF